LEQDIAKNFSPDEKQRQALDKEKERIDGLTKNINEKLSATNRILSALAGDSKLALSVIKTYFIVVCKVKVQTMQERPP
jgi:hypothetical protein